MNSQNKPSGLVGDFMEGKWLSVLEYATFKDKSISTVRRYIKANRVKFKEENGKYYIFTKNFFDPKLKEEKDLIELKFENERLKKELRKLGEENEEMRMLINIYESQKLTSRDLPTLPVSYE